MGEMAISNYVLTISLVLLMIILVTPALYIPIEGEIQNMRGRRMIKIAKANGPIVVINSDHGVTAVCSYNTYQEVAQLSLDQIMGEQDSKKQADLFMTKRELLVIPTFTFSEDSARLMAHTGSMDSCNKLRDKLVEKVTGYKRGKVSFSDIDVAAHYLMIEKDDLLIPFKRKVLGGLDSLGQVKAFGNKSVQDAFLALIPKK